MPELIAARGELIGIGGGLVGVCRRLIRIGERLSRGGRQCLVRSPSGSPVGRVWSGPASPTVSAVSCHLPPALCSARAAEPTYGSRMARASVISRATASVSVIELNGLARNVAGVASRSRAGMESSA